MATFEVCVYKDTTVKAIAQHRVTYRHYRLQSIESIDFGERRWGGPTIADRSGTSSKERKHAVAYEWCGEKRFYDMLPTSKMMVS